MRVSSRDLAARRAASAGHSDARGAEISMKSREVAIAMMPSLPSRCRTAVEATLRAMATVRLVGPTSETSGERAPPAFQLSRVREDRRADEVET
jgi:hypothetical protein